MGRTILIIDDSSIFRRILKSCFPESHDYQIHEAANGQEGLEKYTEFRPDITFMDLTMPVLDGVACLKLIREKNPAAVVVVSTADVQARSIEQVLALGALTVLKKPPTKERFREVLAEAEAAVDALVGSYP